MLLSVIIPAYNEEKRIGTTIQSVLNYLEKQTYSYEIIVVDDCSGDGTSKIVREWQFRRTVIRLIQNEVNRGKGYSVQKGMLEAKGDYRLFMDADSSTSIDHVSLLLPYFEKGYDCVIGSRRITGAKITIKQSPIRKFLGAIFRALVRIIVPLGVVDSQNGFKMFRKEATEIIFPKQRTFGWAFDVEILAIARKYDLKIQEVPIVWENDTDSKMTFAGMLRSLFEIVEIRINLWKNVYGKN